MTAACTHDDFAAAAVVERVEQDGRLAGLFVAVSVRCAGCGEYLRFRGVPLGVSPAHPTAEIGLAKVSLPAYLANDPLLGLDLPTYTVSFGDDE